LLSSVSGVDNGNVDDVVEAEKMRVGVLIGVMEQQLFSQAYVASLMHIDVLPEAPIGGYAARLTSPPVAVLKSRRLVGLSKNLDSYRLERLL
jgi:hypothetical protein